MTRLPPLRVCRACGRRFRSWAEDRYCGRLNCVAERIGVQLPTPPARRSPMPGDLPEGF